MRTTNILTRHWAAIGILLAIAVATGIYLAAGLQASDGTLIMPLDDTYIHFQYARQMAEGEPFIYNPGQEATSGATSLLYTPLLALGYLSGFTGLSLSYWAVLLGSLFFLGSCWLIYELVQIQAHRPLLAVSIMAAFGLSGPFIWAALSGMETMLFTFSVLLALYAYMLDRQWLILISIVMVAWARPEGAIVALTIALMFVYRYGWRRGSGFILAALAAVAVQPVLNTVMTGSFSASGNQAKSLLYNPFMSFDQQVEAVIRQWARLWRELITGINQVDGMYYLPLLMLVGLVYGIWQSVSALRQPQARPALLIMIWLLAISLGIASLDTAFWHFKRYQIPLMALLYILTGWGLAWLWRPNWRRYIVQLIVLLVLAVNISTLRHFYTHYENNIKVVRNQQVAMARWVGTHLPAEAVIGVHDVGVMRYIGNRTTFDVVGLTSADVARAWRQGPGTLYETLQRAQPDYMAIYPDIQGLPLLVEAGVYGETLATFHYPLPENTVASATSTQLVTQPDWETLRGGVRNTHQPFIVPDGFTLLDQVNIADLEDEEAAGYEWWYDTVPSGFNTLVRTLSYHACDMEPCTVTDGGRLLNGGERLNLPATNQPNYLVVLRVQAGHAAYLRVGCDSNQQVIAVPSIPGHWVELPVMIEASANMFCIEGSYESYYYWVYEGAAPADEQIEADLWFNIGEGKLGAEIMDMSVEGDEAFITVRWMADTTLDQDGKLFIHIYNDVDSPPVNQIDQWIGGAIPPANLIPGLVIMETYRVPLPEGEHRLAIGMYDPVTATRYQLDDGSERYWLGSLSR